MLLRNTYHLQEYEPNTVDIKSIWQIQLFKNQQNINKTNKTEHNFPQREAISENEVEVIQSRY